MIRFTALFIFSVLLANIDLNAQYSSTQILRGTWLNKKYIEALENTKSARASQKAIYLAFIEFDKKEAHIIFNFHEGVTLSYEKNGNTIEIGDFKLTLLSKNELEVIESSRIDTLIKTPYKFSNYQNPAANNIIFVGNYRLNSSQNEQIVSFLTDGRIEELNKFKNYTIQSSYYDIGSDVDIVTFSGLDTEIDFTWEVNSDTLNIYNIKCIESDGEDCWKIAKGELQYSLIKFK